MLSSSPRALSVQILIWYCPQKQTVSKQPPKTYFRIKERKLHKRVSFILWNLLDCQIQMFVTIKFISQL